jgi:hypothetical protein
MNPDRFAAARHVADAVLYEGYVLYPYRASAQKNQLRWQFGVLAPRTYAISTGSERWSMRTEVIVDPGRDPRLTVRIRCLQVQHRELEATADNGTTFTPVESLVVDGVTVVPWDEAMDREIDVDTVDLVVSETTLQPFELAAGSEVELLRSRGDVVGRLVRQRTGRRSRGVAVGPVDDGC